MMAVPMRLRTLPWLVGLCAILATSTQALAKGPTFTRSELSNGAVLLVSEQHGVPMAVVHVLLDAGARRDPVGKEGLANMTADLLTEGTKSRSATQISAAVDRLGASLDSAAGMDSASLSMTVLTKHWDEGLALLLDSLLRPSFPNAEVERRREATLAAMKAAEDQPGHVVSRTFTETLFKGEPYGHAADGTKASVAKLSRPDLLAFYAKYYQPRGTIITVVGDVDANKVRADFEAALSAWKPTDVQPFDYPPPPAPQPQVIVIPKPIPQANITLGHRGLRRDDPDYYAVLVMNFILGGGGFGSRLLDDIRTRAGLAYSVGSGYTAPKAAGSFRVEMQTKTASAREAVELACAQLRRVRDELVTESELEDAKLYLTGSFPLQFDSNSEIAGFLTSVEFFGLGKHYADDYLAKINAITREDIQRVARTFVRPDETLLVVAGELTDGDLPHPACAAPTAPEGTGR